MAENDFYTITEPVEWAKAPPVFSYSSLQAIKRCPLQWQLLHSRYGKDLHRFPARPSPAATEGDIIHSVLEKLFRTLSLKGLPALGSPGFRDCVAQLDIKKEVSFRVSAHEKKILEHPRGSGFRVRSSSQQLTNKIIRLFRQQYTALASQTNHLLDGVCQEEVVPKLFHNGTANPDFLLKTTGALSEFKITHATLPFVGIIDFIFLEEGKPVIIHFKTGNQDTEHRKQVMTYAVLWKSQTGNIPKRVEVRYPHAVDSFLIDDKKIAESEDQLDSEIDFAIMELSSKPANARVGEQCRFCDVRQFCSRFWAQKQGMFKVDHKNIKFIDVEMIITGSPTQYGFEGKTEHGEELIFTCSRNLPKLHLKLSGGQKIRVLNALVKETELIITEQTEIYHFDTTPNRTIE